MQACPPVSPGDISSPGFCPTNKSDWGALMCHPACVILRRVMITVCSQGTASPGPASSPVSPSFSPVTGSMSPSSASQILARKKRRGVSGSRVTGGSLGLFLSFPALTFSSLCPADHREETARSDQPQPVGAAEAGAQRFREAGI